MQPACIVPQIVRHLLDQYVALLILTPEWAAPQMLPHSLALVPRCNKCTHVSAYEKPDA